MMRHYLLYIKQHLCINERMQQDEEEILEWLRKHPDLLKRVGNLNEVAQSGPGNMNRIDLAEGEVIRQVDAIGLEILSQWAAHKQTQASAEALAQEKTRRHSKKNS